MCLAKINRALGSRPEALPLFSLSYFWPKYSIQYVQYCTDQNHESIYLHISSSDAYTYWCVISNIFNLKGLSHESCDISFINKNFYWSYLRHHRVFLSLNFFKYLNLQLPYNCMSPRNWSEIFATDVIENFINNKTVLLMNIPLKRVRRTWSLGLLFSVGTRHRGVLLHSSLFTVDYPV